MAIRTCFFDMGNVLVNFSHDRMVTNLAGVAGVSEAEIRRFLFDEGRQWQLERGELSEEQFHRDLIARVGAELNLDDVCNAAADIFWLNEPIVPVVEELKSRGIRLVLLSNTSVTHFRFIFRKFRILQLMDDYVTSYEAGAMKPDSRIYDMALSKAFCEPIECFYTDDIPAYIDAARTHGINASVFRSAEELRLTLATLGVL